MVVTYLFPYCTTFCPAVTHVLTELEADLKTAGLNGKRVQIVAFNVDPENTGPKEMRALPPAVRGRPQRPELDLRDRHPRPRSTTSCRTASASTSSRSCAPTRPSRSPRRRPRAPTRPSPRCPTRSSTRPSPTTTSCTTTRSTSSPRAGASPRSSRPAPRSPRPTSTRRPRRDRRPMTPSRTTGRRRSPCTPRCRQWEFDRYLACRRRASPAVLYVAGVVQMHRRGDGWSWLRTVSFLVGGLGSIVIATMSFVGAYDDTLFTDHMVQHMILSMVVAGVPGAGRAGDAGPAGAAADARARCCARA